MNHDTETNVEKKDYSLEGKTTADVLKTLAYGQ